MGGHIVHGVREGIITERLTGKHFLMYFSERIQELGPLNWSNVFVPVYGLTGRGGGAASRGRYQLIW